MNLRKLLWPDIPESQWNDWQWQVKNRLQGKDGLERLGSTLGIDVSRRLRVLNRYKWAATPYYLNLMASRDVSLDPVGRQVIPSGKETGVTSSSASPDPLKERHYSPVRGLIHRYRDRVVLLATGFCASYCRHCNRKRTWNRPECVILSEEKLKLVRDYLLSNPHVREVLVSGGDPLLLPMEHIARLLEALRSIPSIEILRIGTRVPVVLPMRITEDLCRLLKRQRPIWINTHFNHPVEITKEAKAAIERIQLAGIPVSNQSVLLRGINDNYDTLRSLFCRLQAIMVRPYYLFQCDHVSGTRHFWVPMKKGIRMMDRMWGDVGGMCVPNFVADLSEGSGKARLLSSHLIELGRKEAIFATFEKKIVKIKLE